MRRRARLTAVATLALLFSSACRAQVEVRRLDCGTVAIPDAGFLNDTGLLDGQPRTVAVSCYLVRNGNRHLLWDAGLAWPGRTATGATATLPRTIVGQLREAGVDPASVGVVGLSHYHADHAGQLRHFATATLLMGAQDWAVLRGAGPAFNLDRRLFAPWLRGRSKVTPVSGDHDVFGDGRVVMLAAPGHTPGHHVRLVRARSGTVILAGDLWHLASQAATAGVPRINSSRADTLAAMRRVRTIAATEGARLVLGHDPRDAGALSDADPPQDSQD